MPKLTETYARKISQTNSGTQKYWDNEIKGLVLFVGKKSKTWYFQKDVGGQTRRVLIGRFPMISANAARQTAMGFALDWGRGAGKFIQIGAPALQDALDAYLARPKLNAHYKDTPRRFTAKDAQTVMQEKFDLTPNAAGDAWNVANLPKSEFRNIKRKLKISIEEIRKFNETRG